MDDGDMNEDEENEENMPTGKQSNLTCAELLSVILAASTIEVAEHGTSSALESFGYVGVIDNVDMNIRRSYQRCDRTTASYHFCHGYAVLNRIDTSNLSDGPPSGTLSVEQLLPNSSDKK